MFKVSNNSTHYYGSVYLKTFAKNNTIGRNLPLNQAFEKLHNGKPHCKWTFSVLMVFIKPLNITLKKYIIVKPEVIGF